MGWCVNAGYLLFSRIQRKEESAVAAERDFLLASRMIRSVLILSSLIFFATSASAQVRSEPVEGLRVNTPRVHVLRGATLVPSPGRLVENSVVVLRDGLIEFAGDAGKFKVPAGAREWDVSGKTIYAGFIDPWVALKVADAEGELARHWNSKIRPERFAARALETVSADKVKELRGLGFTAAQLVPDAGIFRGSSCLIVLRNGESGSRIISKRVAQCVAFEHGGGGYPTSLMGSIALMRQTLYDAQWQRDSRDRYQKNPKGIERTEANESLDALRSVVDGKQRVLFRTHDELSYSRFSKVAAEFGIKGGLLGCGFEYRVVDAVRSMASPLVLPLNFPKPPPVEDIDAALEVSLAELEHWEMAPSNAAMLEKADLPFSVSTARLADAKGAFWKNLRLAVERGLSKDAALAALTIEPAKLVGAYGKIGTVSAGKMANLVISDGDLFEGEDARVQAVWVDGIHFEQAAGKEIDLAGKWEVAIDGQKQSWEISGSVESLKLKIGGKTFSAKVGSGRWLMAFPDAGAIREGANGVVRLSADVQVGDRSLGGRGVMPGGESIQWSAIWKGELEKKPKEPSEASSISEVEFVRYPAGAFGRLEQPELATSVVIRNATLWTCAQAGVLKQGDLLIQEGKIAAVGKDLKVPAGTREIQADGDLHVTPGLIDCHSHVAISRGVNEGTHAVTVEVRIGDVLDPTDINLYRQLAGGLTASNLLHGSANPMGGQNQVIKLRWGSDAEGLRFKGAKPGVKFALGENVKQSNWGNDKTTRYPQTRMGVQQIMRDTFLAARDYERDDGGRRNLRLDAALEILEGDRIVHIHSYRQDEILMFVRLAEELGFTVGTFQHVLEGYKVADEIARIGAGGSTFSDWWAYKMEVYDAIPFNGALMRDVGVLTSFNSDNAELATRMNLEAAKAVKYGGVPEAEALKFVTLNPAKQLRIDDRVGSLEPGKDADFVIWSEHPMSGRAKALETWIDGRKYFDRDQDAAEVSRIGEARERLIAKALKERVKSGGKEKDGEKLDGKEKPGLRGLFRNGLAEGECRSVYKGLYHNGRSLHTCSRNSCCSN
ncbi:MAG: imidazolonepropionase-like amidohydrolase [Verrucomicrobiales bacterium]